MVFGNFWKKIKIFTFFIQIAINSHEFVGFPRVAHVSINIVVVLMSTSWIPMLSRTGFKSWPAAVCIKKALSLRIDKWFMFPPSFKLGKSSQQFTKTNQQQQMLLSYPPFFEPMLRRLWLLPFQWVLIGLAAGTECTLLAPILSLLLCICEPPDTWGPALFNIQVLIYVLWSTWYVVTWCDMYK